MATAIGAIACSWSHMSLNQMYPLSFCHVKGLRRAGDTTTTAYIAYTDE